MAAPVAKSNWVVLKSLKINIHTISDHNVSENASPKIYGECKCNIFYLVSAAKYGYSCHKYPKTINQTANASNVEKWSW